MDSEVVFTKVVEAVVEPMFSLPMTAKVPSAGLVAAHAPFAALANWAIWEKVIAFASVSPIWTHGWSPVRPQFCPFPSSPHTVITASWIVLSVVVAILIGYLIVAGLIVVSASHSPAKTTEKFWAAWMSNVWEEAIFPDAVTVREKVLKLVLFPAVPSPPDPSGSYLKTSVVMVCCPISPPPAVVFGQPESVAPVMSFSVTSAPSIGTFAESTTLRSKVNALSIAPNEVVVPLNSIPGSVGVGVREIPKAELTRVVVAL